MKAQNPDAPQITIAPETASVTLGTTGNGRATDKYEFNRRSGEVTPATKYADSVPADKLRGWIYAVHTGTWGGLLTRILWLLGALLGASLPLTGYYIWIKHLLRKKHRGHTANAH
ncbi:MAG: PepSY domain-containing protein [Paramuribaculum sp.]|nr:PepSY domain-containing protein [Paramuribaculum sp.]